MKQELRYYWKIEIMNQNELSVTCAHSHLSMFFPGLLFFTFSLVKLKPTLLYVMNILINFIFEHA